MIASERDDDGQAAKRSHRAAWRRAWERKHRKRIAAQRRARYQKNREKILAASRAYRAAKREQMLEKLWTSLWGPPAENCS